MAKKTAKKATKKAAKKQSSTTSTKSKTKKSPTKTTTKDVKSATKKAPVAKEKDQGSKKPILITLLIIVLLILLVIFAVTKINPAVATATGADVTITNTDAGVSIDAKPNGNTIVVSETTYEYIELLFSLNGIDIEQDAIIEEAVLREVLYANAKAAGKASDEVISEEIFNARLYDSNYTYESFIKKFGSEITKDFIVQQYFNDNILATIPSQDVASASHILICYSGKVLCEQNRTRDEAQNLADDILSQARSDNNQAKFAELASEYSDGPSNVQGGQLNPFTRGEMVPEFDSVVFDMQAGDIAGLVETDYGFHIIRLNALEQVPDQQVSLQVLTEMKNSIMAAVEIQ